MTFAYITESGTKIGKRGGRLVVGRNQEVILEISLETLEGLVLFGNIQVSSRAMTEFLKRNISVTWLSSTGSFFGRLESTKNVNVHRQQKQFLLDNDEVFSLELAKKTILAKISNQLTLLRRYNRTRNISAVESDIKNIYAIRKNIFKADNKESLMGFEGYIAKCYFDGLGKIVPEEFKFNGRNKRPPKDPVNSLLSFGYTLLMYEIYTAICNYGLHPYFGFLHKLKEGHPTLASDLMETWRAIIVDSMVMKMVMRNEVDSDDFSYDPKSGGVLISELARKKFLKEYENKMRSKSLYVDEKRTFRDILDSQVGEFASCVEHNDLSLYEPIVIR